MEGTARQPVFPTAQISLSARAEIPLSPPQPFTLALGTAHHNNGHCETTGLAVAVNVAVAVAVKVTVDETVAVAVPVAVDVNVAQGAGGESESSKVLLDSFDSYTSSR
jgi:hypothetical protein